jgi:aspartate-semialdehyde dehydrogenase
MIRCLERRAFPVAALRPLASPRSAGKSVAFKGAPLRVEAVSEEAFEGVDFALFAADADVSRRYAPVAMRAGAVVVDNSSAFRMDEGVPLVVPEVNPEALDRHTGLVANPNCTAALMVMALTPLHRISPIRRVIAATYQAASGAGAAAMQELEDATRAHLEGRAYEQKVLPHPYAFNLFSHNAAMDPVTGYNGEEEKVMNEVRKLMNAPELRVGITCVRVPVRRAHAEALTIEFEAPVSVAQAREALSAFPGVRLVDDRARNYFPMPIDASGQDDVLVGRIREDVSDPSGRSLALFLSGDQLLKGAALNAVQIMERLA